MKRLLFFLILIVAVMFTYTAQATGYLTCCSPGYWKNHVEIWYGAGCGERVRLGISIDDETLLDMLTPQEGDYGTRRDRQIAAVLLNTCRRVEANCDD